MGQSSQDQKIKLLTAVAANTLTETQYKALLRRAEWSESDLLLVFQPEDIREFLASIRASINAGNEIFSRRDRDTRSFVVDGSACFFDPLIITPWIIDKEIPGISDRVIAWYDQQIHATEASAPVPAYYSDDLKILIQASNKFWGNVNPDEKDTHTKQQVVIDWLVEKGFSDISARKGATIIRPKWAAKGKY